MARLSSKVIIFAIFAVGYLEASKQPDNDSINIRNVKWKFDMLLDELQDIPNAIRKLSIGAGDREQLSSIVISYLTLCNYQLNILNVVAPSSFDKVGYDTLVTSIKELHQHINSIQGVLNEKPEVAQNGFAAALEEAIPKIALIKQNDTYGNPVINSQCDKALDLWIFGVVKLKNQILYYKETNQQIAARISSSINKMIEARTALTSTSKIALVDIRHRCVLLEQLTERVVNNMLNWIELNPKETKGVQIAKAVIDAMIEAFRKIPLAIINLETTDELKHELVSIYINGVQAIQKLGEIESPEKSEGQEFIRSTLYDGLSVGVAFAETFKKLPRDA